MLFLCFGQNSWSCSKQDSVDSQSRKDPIIISSLQVVSGTARRPSFNIQHLLQSESVRMTRAAMTWLHVISLLVLCVRDSTSLFLPDSTELRQLLSRYQEETDRNSTGNTAGSRTRRAILWSDREEILQLHNKLRGNVYPTASDMEHMVRHVPLLQLLVLQSFLKVIKL